MTPAHGIAVIACAIAVIAAIRDSVADSDEEAIRFLQTYGYLDGDNVQTISDNATLALRHAIALFQEYYRIPGDGVLNEATLEQMRKPRCGVKDILNDLDDSPRKWAKTHLTWNFHLASESVLRVTEVAFEIWAANSSLMFERNSTNPDIVISFRKDFHTFVDPRHQGSRICPSLLEGPGNVLAHAFLPSSEVSEVHVDSAEKWHIELTVNPDDTIHLLHTLTHEIGHALGLHHNPLKDAIMYAFVLSKTFPVRLSEADFLAIQNLYGLRNKSEIAGPVTTTVTTTTIATRDTGNSADLCALRRVDAVLVLENRISVTMAGKFDSEIFGIVCPKDGLLEQLRALLKRLAQMRNVFSSEDDLEEEREEEEARKFSHSV
ncbi:matrilysin-like [Pogonomyrmex barbatus]|uniref:Matrilysin-like n=1 Tax=Pogonomyrmex barbatus TaxID=144034 RepID=A0A6I9VWL0_9HYME|nr:matrilysin-like [Pogonomyrmex barbatus]